VDGFNQGPDSSSEPCVGLRALRKDLRLIIPSVLLIYTLTSSCSLTEEEEGALGPLQL
jgi:hypothetical protein